MRWADGPILSIAGSPPEGTPEASSSEADNGAIARASVLVRFQGPCPTGYFARVGIVGCR